MCICEACPMEGFSSGIRSHRCFLKVFSSYLSDWFICYGGFSFLLFILQSGIEPSVIHQHFLFAFATAALQLLLTSTALQKMLLHLWLNIAISQQ